MNRAAELQRLVNRTLEPVEASAYLAAPVTDAEREDVLTLVRWFRRRYPAPLDRLRFVRRAHARWRATQGIAGPSSR